MYCGFETFLHSIDRIYTYDAVASAYIASNYDITMVLYEREIIAFRVVILSDKIFIRWCRRAMDRFASFLIYDIDFGWNYLNTSIRQCANSAWNSIAFPLNHLTASFILRSIYFWTYNNGADDNDRSQQQMVRTTVRFSLVLTPCRYRVTTIQIIIILLCSLHVL